MPTLISRQQALDEINNSLPSGECLACNLLSKQSNFVLHKGIHCTVLLSKYPRTWGQTMIVLNKHKEAFSEIEADEWKEMTEAIKKFSVAIEKALKPIRCYVAALGSPENLPNTCAHIHFNIIPVYDATHKPNEIFTWEHGVYSGSNDEWKKLYEDIKNSII